jgi:hypothetical protein
MRQYPYGAEAPFSRPWGAARLAKSSFPHFNSVSPTGYWFLQQVLQDKDGARKVPFSRPQKPVIANQKRT